MTATSPLVLKIDEESGRWGGSHDPCGGIVVTRSLVAAPSPPPTQSFAEPDPLDVRLHAPTKDVVIVWVAGPIRRADSPLLTLRVRQQFDRAVHVILDLSSVTWLDTAVAADLRALEAHAHSRGCRLHIAGAENAAVAEPLLHLDAAHLLAYGPADAVLAVLAARTTEAPMENAQ
jgi:anti-anti-sigma regulatory factor